MTKKLRTALIDSIRHHALPPFTDVSLGKLLTDVRKLLEATNQETQYPTLKLFCDWVVHAKLSGKKVQNLLAEMDDYYEQSGQAHLKREPPPGPQAMSETLRNFITMQGFKNELSVFLSGTCGVETPHVLDKNNWADFENTYCKIVRDCLLLYENKKKPLKHFDRAIVSIQPLQWNPAQIKYDPLTVHSGVQWVFLRGDGETFRMLITWGGRPAMQDGLGPRISPQTQTPSA